ncbi:unnamed protein product [Lota lota]
MEERQSDLMGVRTYTWMTLTTGADELSSASYQGEPPPPPPPPPPPASWKKTDIVLRKRMYRRTTVWLCLLKRGVVMVLYQWFPSFSFVAPPAMNPHCKDQLLKLL